MNRHRRGFGGRDPFGFGGPRGGGRARRGDVRAAIITLLAEEPRNGYGIIQELQERTSGAWKPSPGSVYPTLAQLEDEGLIRPVEGGGKAFELTDKGRTEAAERAEQGPAPWEAVTGPAGESAGELRDAARQLIDAVWQVGRSGSDDQVKAATAALTDARKAIYKVLAG